MAGPGGANRATLSMVPPRVQLANADGEITREWYRLLAGLYSDSPSVQDMANIKRRLASVILPASVAAQYTAPANTRTTINAATLTNSTAGAVAVSVWLVPAGDAPGAANIVLSAVSIAAGASRVVTEIVEQVIEAAGSLQAQGAGVTLVVTGTEQT